MAVKEWKLVGIVGNDGRSGLLEADDAKNGDDEDEGNCDLAGCEG